MNDERRKEIKLKVLEVFQMYFQIFNEPISLPVPIKKITKMYSNCRLIKYSTHMRIFNLSYEQMLNHADSKDGYTDYDNSSNLYTIYYNDLDISIMKSNRYRWNIAHELGHMILEHAKNDENTRLFRRRLSESVYTKYEDEADIFASYLLVPYSELYLYKVSKSSQIETFCKISSIASEVRMRYYNQWFHNGKFKDSYDFKVLTIFDNFLECTTCKYTYPTYEKMFRKFKYCPICGQKSRFNYVFKKVRTKIMKYKSVELNSLEKPHECPICHNEETEIEGDYCQICGTILINRCSNCSGSVPLPPNARYCPYCGSPSTYLQTGILLPWDKSSNDDLDDLIEVEDGDLPF